MSREIAELLWAAGIICSFVVAPVGFWKTLKAFNTVKLNEQSGLPFGKNASWSDVTNQRLFWKYIIRKRYAGLSDVRLRKQCTVIRNLFFLEVSIFVVAICSQAYVIYTGL